LTLPQKTGTATRTGTAATIPTPSNLSQTRSARDLTDLTIRTAIITGTGPITSSRPDRTIITTTIVTTTTVKSLGFDIRTYFFNRI
jgi:hypothetical protein